MGGETKCACRLSSDKYTVKKSLQFGAKMSGHRRPALHSCLEMNCQTSKSNRDLNDELTLLV